MSPPEPDRERQEEPRRGTRADDRTLTAVAWCWRGGRKHRAYMDSHRIGGEVWWCPRHGVIMTRTLRIGNHVWMKRAPRRFFSGRGRA